MDQSSEAVGAVQRLEGTVGLYWRTRNRYGAPHHPTVMTLRKGRLMAVTADGTVLLDAPVDEFAVRFTRWGTIILTRGEEVIRFVAGSYAGILAKPFTDNQRREIAAAIALPILVVLIGGIVWLVSALTL